MNIPAMLRSFSLNIPTDASRIYNLSGSSVALSLAMHKEPFIAIEQTEEMAFRLYEDIEFFRSVIKTFENELPSVLFLPDQNGPQSSGRRAEVFSRVEQREALVTSARGMQAPAWSRDDLERDSLSFTRGQGMERDSVGERLGSLGFKRVSIVVEKGEYCLKGWLLDIFPASSEDPVRIEFFGDEIEAIRSFDIETQKSTGQIDTLVVLPVKEPAPGHRIGSLFRGREFLIDLPGEQAYKADAGVVLSRFAFQGEGFDGGLLSLQGHGIFPDERKTLADFAHALRLLAAENRVMVVSSSLGQAERVRDILLEGDLIAPLIDIGEVASYEGSVSITTGSLSSGFFLPGLVVLTEKEIFGERPSYRPIKRSRVSGLLASIDEIAPGDFVVHRDHGIGRFLNIQKQTSGDHESELIVLEYTGGDKLYIPLYNINKIKKYTAEEGVLPHLDRLGGRTWQRTKERARKAVREMAERLLKLYAEREIVRGFAFSTDTELHREFYGFFPYEETPDQVKAIEEIRRDLEAEKPMERLLCGDVGYGKTEVAMRAAFKAMFDGRQVAVLVPTTILCEQHYLTFTARFSAFPVRIDYLSRFKSKSEQDATRKALSRGEIDIIIGTQALLKKDLTFENLGLLIIDEEHRFGVSQKERIKELKSGVDVLSMTATPIPRTLQMAFSGIRGMSLIETPPEERLAVRSIVSVFDEVLIKEAVERELRRGGQVLFVHNVISDIEKVAALLKRLLPHATIDIAHGQMPEKRLEEVMHRFFRKDLDVLLSTNIIGAGIDIPTANTIIIDRADKMGLADLYQLRGRVGRSNVKAYAYFLIPGEHFITDEAKKRLQAIRDMSYLGAGFRLAMKDLEIRGAGNLLGPQQSGHVHAVGFDMYMEMLAKAVSEVKGIEMKEEFEPTINLSVSAFIPEGYIEDLALRLSMYRRIANAKAEEDINGIESEMLDRFGVLPGEVKRLTDIMRLKVMAKQLLLAGISETNGKLRFVFSGDAAARADDILSLQKTFSDIRFHKNGFEIDCKRLPNGHDASGIAHDLLQELLNRHPAFASP